MSNAVRLLPRATVSAHTYLEGHDGDKRGHGEIFHLDASTRRSRYIPPLDCRHESTKACSDVARFVRVRYPYALNQAPKSIAGTRTEASALGYNDQRRR